MKDSQQENFWYAKTFTLEQRKNWYAEIADVYNRVRPRYPKQLVSRAIQLSQLPSQAEILEVGCGTGTATVEFAEFGFSMLCLEPNQEFCRIAKQNCSQYPSVEIRNTLFEEWELEGEKFNAVLMANAIHWIPPDLLLYRPFSSVSVREISKFYLTSFILFDRIAISTHSFSIDD